MLKEQQQLVLTFIILGHNSFWALPIKKNTRTPLPPRKKKERKENRDLFPAYFQSQSALQWQRKPVLSARIWFGGIAAFNNGDVCVWVFAFTNLHKNALANKSQRISTHVVIFPNVISIIESQKLNTAFTKEPLTWDLSYITTIYILSVLCF